MIEGTLPFKTRIGLWPMLASSDLETKNNNKKAKRNMKTITKTILYLQMTALCLTAALAGRAAAEEQSPIKGSIQGVEIADVQFPRLFVDGSGSGMATHLGRFTVTYELEVDLIAHETFGSSLFTAANGDSLATDITGLGTPTENPDVVSVVEVHTITGGTGRFADATGNFIRTYFLDLVTGVTSGSFNGTIGFGKTK